MLKRGFIYRALARPNLNHFDELQALKDPGSDLVERIMMLTRSF